MAQSQLQQALLGARQALKAGEVRLRCDCMRILSVAAVWMRSKGAALRSMPLNPRSAASP